MSQIPSGASIRARLAERRHPRCPHCQQTDVTGLHVVRCADTQRYRQAVTEAASAASMPEVTALDLWAHVRSRTSNEFTAALVVQVVIDLGWRPVVGNDPARLWGSPDINEPEIR